MKKEIWKDIEGYEGKYQVSNLGRVRDTNYRNTHKTVIRKPQTTDGGYKYLRIQVNGVKQHFYIHILVYETFIGKIPEGMQVNHIDENKANNFVENLNLMTPEDNANHGTRNKRISESKLKHHPKAVKIAQYTLNGELIKIYPSARRAELDGFDHSHIIQVCNGTYKQYKGFIWRYA